MPADLRELIESGRGEGAAMPKLPACPGLAGLGGGMLPGLGGSRSAAAGAADDKEFPGFPFEKRVRSARRTRMSLKIRLSRGGAKKRPYYRIVVAEATAPRDGRFIEKIGTFNPLLPRTAPERLMLDQERAQHWLKSGAQPTDRVLRMLDGLGLAKREARNNPNKAKPSKKRQEREKAAADAAAKAAEAAEAAETAAAPEQPQPQG